MNAQPQNIVLDEVPERYPYRDEGCELSPSCLRCSLPQCKYDDPGWVKRQERHDRDTEVLRTLRLEGLSVIEVASRFRLSQRTVFRILKRTATEASAA